MFYDAHSHKIKSNTIANIYPNEPVPKEYFFSSGVHPWFCENYNSQLEQIENNLSLTNCLAIGECGLDRICQTDLEIQQLVFNAQVDLANKYKKPLIIHCVKAFDLLQGALNRIKVPVIIHGFNQNSNILTQLLKHENLSISLGAALLKEGSNAQKALLTTPLARVFLETDDNLEIDIAEVYERASELLNLPIGDLSNQIEQNFTKVFI